MLTNNGYIPETSSPCLMRADCGAAACLHALPCYCISDVDRGQHDQHQRGGGGALRVSHHQCCVHTTQLWLCPRVRHLQSAGTERQDLQDQLNRGEVTTGHHHCWY